MEWAAGLRCRGGAEPHGNRTARKLEGWKTSPQPEPSLRWKRLGRGPGEGPSEFQNEHG